MKPAYQRAGKIYYLRLEPSAPRAECEEVMPKRKFTSKGQAATELAIFGSLIIICFASLLSYSQSFTENQALQQQSFRMALQKAYDDNGFVSYHISKNPRSVNPSANFKASSRSGTSASSTVMWSKGIPESHSYYQINEDMIELPLFEQDGVDTPASVWDVQTNTVSNYTGNEGKHENSGGMQTTRGASFSDTINTTLRLHYQAVKNGPYINATDIVIVQGLDDDGRYRQSAAGTTVTRGRTWQTPHPKIRE